MSDYYGPRAAAAAANSTTEGVQARPRAARLAGGSYVVVWEDRSTSPDDPSDAAIRGQWFYPGGQKLGGEFLVNTVTAGNQWDPSIAALANGSFVVAWTGTDINFTGIKAQLYTSNGAKAGGEFQVNTTYLDTQTEARVANIGSSFAIVWLDKSGSGTAIRAQFYSSAGSKLGGEVLVSTHFAEVHSGLTVAQVGPTSSIVVSWTQTNGDGTDAAVMAQMVSLDGTLLGGPVHVSETTTGNQLDASVATYAPSLGFIIAYVDNSSTGSSGAIKVRIFDSNGAATGPDRTITGIGETGSDPSVTAYASGLFAVSWRNSSGSVRMQVFHPTEGALGDDFAVTDGGATGEGAVLLPLADDSFLAVWADGDIQTRAFDAAPVLLDLLLSDTILSEGLPEHLPVAQLATTGIGGSTGVTYSILSDSTGGGFAIHGDRLVVADRSRIDFETSAQAEVTIRAINAQGDFREETFNLTIADAAIEPAPWSASPLIPANNAPWGPRVPDIAPLASGGFVMVYDDSRFSAPGGPNPIRGQVFSPAGTPVGAEFEVDIFDDYNAHPVAVGGLAGGGFVVIFTDYRDGAGDTGAQLRGQIFDEDGSAVGAQFKVATTAAGGQSIGQVVGLPSGGFVIVWNNGWSGKIPTVSDVKAQLFDAAGNKVGGEIVVPSTNAWMQREPDVAVLTDGSFIITWTEDDNRAIFAQRFEADGDRVGDSFQVSTSAADHKYSPSIAWLAGGGFVVSWQHGRGYGASTPNPWDVKAQIFDASGIPVGGEFLVHNDPLGAQRMSIVTPLKDGGFVVTWNEHASPNGENSVQGSTKAQMFDSTGTKIGVEIAINQSFAERHLYTAAAALTWGGFVVGYADDAGNTPGGRTVSARMFTPTGFDARDDAALTDEATAIAGNIFADNGGGVDIAPSNGTLVVVEVNGSATDVDDTIALPSGALLTLNADGTFSYDPNHAFDALALYGSGGSNVEATDSFSYRLVGGDTATMTVTIRGLYSAPHTILGTSGADTLSGTGLADLFMANAGGDDRASGGDGGDAFYFGSAFTNADVADGGGGRDAVILQGNYTRTLSAANLIGVEALSLQSGSVAFWGDNASNRYDYNITTLDNFVAAGTQLIVNGQSLLAGEDLTFDGSAEMDGQFLIYAGHGTDTLKGGAGGDVFFFEGQRWSPSDTADGGGGRDVLVISAGTGSNRFVFTDTSFVNIEAVSVSNRFVTDPSQKPSYELVLANGNAAAGQTLIVNGNSLTDADQFVIIDGSAVQNGKLTLYGGEGQDTLKGGGGTDLLYGAGGQDDLIGNGGADIFRYDATSESTSTATDEILDFQTSVDEIDLSRIDANTHVAGDQAFHWIDSDAFGGNVAASAGELRAYQSGGNWIVEGDTDGDGDADLMITVTTQGVAALVPGDFLF